jgi:hypothetical protein
MKIEVKTNETPRKLVAVTRDGMLFFRFGGSSFSDEVVVALGRDPDHLVVSTSTELEYIDGTPIYEGDTVTITF